MDGRVTYEWTDVCVYEWTDVWACVRALTCSLVTCAHTYNNKVDSSRPYFCTFRLFLTYLVLGIESTLFSYVGAHVTSELVNCSTHARTLTRPSTRTNTSVHSYVTRPSPRMLTRTLGRTHVRHHVHLHSSPDVRSPRSLPFTRL